MKKLLILATAMVTKPETGEERIKRAVDKQGREMLDSIAEETLDNMTGKAEAGILRRTMSKNGPG